MLALCRFELLQGGEQFPLVCLYTGRPTIQEQVILIEGVDDATLICLCWSLAGVRFWTAGWAAMRFMMGGWMVIFAFILYAGISVLRSFPFHSPVERGEARALSRSYRRWIEGPIRIDYACIYAVFAPLLVAPCVEQRK